MYLHKNVIIIKAFSSIINVIFILIGLDGQRVIIYGGYSPVKVIAPEDALYVLDLTNYSWYIPKISGKFPKTRYYHQANVIGKYMVISFGKFQI